MQKLQSICFISNFDKTYFFDAIAKKLQSIGFNISWIVVNEKLNRYLLEQYSPESILLLNKSYVHKTSEPVDDFRLNELVYGDRVLKHYKDEGIKFLTNIQRPIHDFFKNRNIQWVVGEVTWAHEILVHRLTKGCKELDCVFLNPHTIRIPNGRYSFFLDEFQSIIYEKSDDAASELHRRDDIIVNSTEFTVEKPDYLVLNDKILKKNRLFSSRLSRIWRFITKENFDPLDPTLVPDRIIQCKLRITEEFNKEMYLFVRRTSLTKLQQVPYVFLGLHKQPEASIDVIGRYHENQLQNIFDLWRILPHGWKLVIKEHTNAIGDRSITGFYNRIKSMPNVIIVDEKADSHELIKKSQLVVTVSGTVAYEAALLGVPSATLGPVFFNKISSCINISSQSFKDIDIVKLSQNKVECGELDKFKEWLIGNSFEGIISDPGSNIECMTERNIESISKCLYAITRSYEF